MVALANFNPIWFVRKVRPLFAYLLLWLATPHHAICKPRELLTPPVGETITERVMRGGSVEMTLKAFEGRGNPLEYVVDSSPQHGRLGEIRQADKNRQSFASVVYTHGDDEDSTSDEFTFRARALVGGGVSSPIKVKLQIIDAPPKLQVTPVVDFSAVAGESDRQQIILANEGGGLIEGRIAPKEPFQVEGEGRFLLGRGQMTNIVVRFLPQSAETVASQKISPSPADPDAKITLRGEARVPLAASAEPMQVQPDGSRTGKIKITNFSDSVIAVNLSTPPDSDVEVKSVANVPAKGAAEVALAIGRERASGEKVIGVTVSSTFGRQDLQVLVPAVPPKLELVMHQLDFRESKETDLSIMNKGGVEGRFTFELPEYIKSIEGAESFAVKPGKIMNVRLRLEKRNDAQTTEAVTVNLGSSDKVMVPLLLPLAEPTPLPPPELAQESQREIPGENSSKPQTDIMAPSLPPERATRKIRSLSIAPERTRAEIHLAIDQDPSITGFRLERGWYDVAVDPRTGRPLMPRFVPLEQSEPTISLNITSAEKDGRKLTVVGTTVEGLQPGTSTLWRLVPLSNGKAMEPTETFMVPTALPFQLPVRGLVLCFMGIFLAAVLWARHKQRRAEFQ